MGLIGPPLWVAAAAPKPARPAESKADKTVAYRADRCRYTQASGAASTASCQGNVKIWRQDLSLACQQLTATFNARGDLANALCIGAVEVVGGGGVAHAERAWFDVGKNSVELTGKPKAQQGPSTLSGKVIRLDVESGELVVEGALGLVSPGVLPDVKAPGAPAQGGTP